MNRFLAFMIILVFSSPVKAQSPAVIRREMKHILEPSVMKEAAKAMQEEPVTVTASRSQRSAGGLHDFFSEGDYWWPDPSNPDGPYIQRDGLTNPDNFTAHREALIRFSRIIGALASAYTLTGDEKYVRQAMRHCRAWFVDTATRMNPSLLYAQAITRKVTGRSIGIIDTIHFMEVVLGLMAMESSAAMNKKEMAAIQGWFEEYIHWLTTHPYGIAESKALNNHGTCWVMQVAAFAKFTGNDSIFRDGARRYREGLLPEQMADNGSFPRELERTKPYGYSIFNLDAMAAICQLYSGTGYDLWHVTIDDKNIRKGIAWLYPYLADKKKWPLPPDVMHWNDWPVAQPSLVFGALTFHEPSWFQCWKRLDHTPQDDEVLRNLPVRHPLIWMN